MEARSTTTDVEPDDDRNTASMVVRFPRALKADLAAIAAKRGWSQARVLRVALEKHLKHPDGDHAILRAEQALADLRADLERERQARAQDRAEAEGRERQRQAQLDAMQRSLDALLAHARPIVNVDAVVAYVRDQPGHKATRQQVYGFLGTDAKDPAQRRAADALLRTATKAADAGREGLRVTRSEPRTYTHTPAKEA